MVTLLLHTVVGAILGILIMLTLASYISSRNEAGSAMPLGSLLTALFSVLTIIWGIFTWWVVG